LRRGPVGGITQQLFVPNQPSLPAVDEKSGLAAMIDTNDARVHDRLRWRARRGLLENDILLSRFFSTELTQLSAEELDTLDKLLRLDDNDLLDLLMGRRISEDARLAPLIARIRAA
jgi:antitoxin CptB